MATNEMTLRLDPANPGQFFACCGLLELADRLWQGAEGWFDEQGVQFHLRALGSDKHSQLDLGKALAECELDNTMTAEEKLRLREFSTMKKSALSSDEESLKKQLEGKRREAPLRLGRPFNLLLDWWLDDRAGGSRFKTWAGQQSVIDIAEKMKQPIANGLLRGVPPKKWLQLTGGEGLPFNFDSDLGPQSAALDVGFSLDPLGISVPARPVIELGALIGLQRFRPWFDADSAKRNRYRYYAWPERLLPAAASVAAMGIVPFADSVAYEFPLLYRTKYLKSFLPAQPMRGDT